MPERIPTPERMHANEADIDAALVHRLLTTQFPHWADLPLRSVSSTGTDNALYQLGDDLAVRLPRIPRVPGADGELTEEHRWLGQLATRLPLAIPVPVGLGTPGADYPGVWSIQRWLPGQDATSVELADPNQAALALGQFIRALQQINPADGPAPRQRGRPLASRDIGTRKAIATLRELKEDAVSTRELDLDAALLRWSAALQAPDWDRPPVWFHGDLLPGNLLIHDDELSAVIDFGCMGVGDPACDAMAAWTVLSEPTRNAFRLASGNDDATWARGRGWALSVGLIALPYYRFSNPTFARVARRAIDEVLADPDLV